MKQKKSDWIWLLLVATGILVYIGWTVVPIIYCHYKGKETVAVITGMSTRMEGGGGGLDSTSRRVHYYRLAFDGHNVEKRSSGKREVGDRLPVIYLVDNPNCVVRGTRADGLWNTVKLSTNEVIVLIAVGMAGVLLACAAKEFRGNP